MLIVYSVLAPILNMPIAESRRQRVLVASSILYSEVVKFFSAVQVHYSSKISMLLFHGNVVILSTCSSFRNFNVYVDVSK